MSKIIYGYNTIADMLIAVFSYILGENWVFFVGFLILNILECITMWLKSNRAKTLKQTGKQKRLRKATEKLGYWLMICLAFEMSTLFMEFGKVLDINMGFVSLIGWFVLASLSVTEIRSICNNFISAGFSVPYILIKALKLADQEINDENDEAKPKSKGEK